MISASVNDRSTRLVLDTVDRGAIPTLRNDDVVEVTSVVDGGGVRSLRQAELPEHAVRLLDRVKAYERLTVEAAVTRSAAAALEALATHPLVGSGDLARELLDRYVEANAGLWPPLS